jgi:hypothetical protein
MACNGRLNAFLKACRIRIRIRFWINADPDEIKQIFFESTTLVDRVQVGWVRNVDAVRAAGVPDLLPVLQDSGLAQGSYQVR